MSSKTEKPGIQNLFEAVRPQFITIVEVSNQTPSNWGAVIVEIGCKFWYQDGAGSLIKDEVFVKRTHVASGGSDSISGTYDGCCRLVKTLIKIEVPGTAQPVVLEHDNQTDASRCLVHVPIALVPKSAVANSPVRGEYFELIEASR